MKTEHLIDILGRDVKRVGPGQLSRSVWSAIAVGAVAAIGAMLLTLGVRSDLPLSDPVLYCVRLGFIFGILVLAARFVMRLARPGGEKGLSLLPISLPFMIIIGLVAISLAAAPPAHWSILARGLWLECLISIPVIAIVPFAVIIWVVRQAAPTDLKRTGAVVGLLAGSISAAAYALHCATDTLPFTAIWFGGTIVLCTWAGAAFGPRLLRW